MRTVSLTICLLAAFLLSADVLAAVSRGNFKDAAHPGKCVINADTILSEGETKTDSNCQLISCHANGDASFSSCGVKGAPDPCKIGDKKYPKAEYPKCCINVLHCPDGDKEL
ncbi:uncharacterized protein LOC6562313 [Drosophila grimshawi]|uniref:GH11662 n=1 Tax=Drosophila grimshawi TaxID=7222 RepID=B4JCL8_DROGR|nr:uncharacterized protein LOC6562313 [Drosophila grimshawi]EDW04182.1 GH11662 [Drosophila grimshawi]